ncbi:MAG: universal stress protein [Pseudomonadota bacterium]
MKRFKNILYVLDNDLEASHSLERAVRLAATNGAELTVAYCVQGMPRDAGTTADTPDEEPWWLLRSEWSGQLERMVAPFRAEGTPITTTVLGGIPFLEIIRRVHAHGHDMLIKPAQAIGGIRNLLFGSTDLHLMRKCPCPVWIHKVPNEPSYDGILAAVDVSSEDEQQQRLNRLIMDLASSLAVSEGSPLHVVHAWSVPGESAARGRAFIRMAKEQVERLVARERERRRGAFLPLIGEYRNRVPELQDHLLKGQTQFVVPEFARTYEIDLIVMGTIGRTGLPGMLMGNTAEDTLRQVDCAVLTVKPEGFVSPVAPATEAPAPLRRRDPVSH